MIHRPFPAEVTNGQLRFDESLADLEGRKVIVVLDVSEPSTTHLPRLSPSPMCDEVSEIDEPVDFERPFRRQIINATIRDGGRLSPCLIFPEDINE